MEVNRKTHIRNSNIELLRIISMILIVAHHYVVNSGLLDTILKNPISVNSIFLLIFGMLGKTCINCFVLITGYFMCKSSITVKKFLKLLTEIMFYRIAIYLIFLFAGYETFSFKRLLEIIVPVSSIQQNFTGCFLVFWLTIPFLNILVRNLDKYMHLLLLGLCGFTYVLMGTVHRVSMNYVSWFIVLYFIASFIQIYDNEILNRRKMWGGYAQSLFLYQ